MTEPGYDLGNIRSLLLNGFDEQDLRQMCLDVPGLRPLRAKLARSMGQA
jgi:hypothetical protein